MLLIGCGLCLMSFFPIFRFGHMNAAGEANLFLFTDTAFMIPQTLLESVEDEDKDGCRRKLDLMLCDQIVATSLIAHGKFRLYALASLFAISATITPVGLIALWMYRSTFQGKAARKVELAIPLRDEEKGSPDD